MKWPWGSRPEQDAQPELKQPSAAPVEVANESEELSVRIVDEKGSDLVAEKPLSSSSVLLPFSALCAFLFAGGVLGGVPLGMSYARSQLEGGEDTPRAKAKGKHQKAGSIARVKVSQAALSDGFWFAGRAFFFGTLLCGAMGVVGVASIRTAYDVDSIEEFGQKMKVAVPRWRKKVERRLDPLLSPLRNVAQESLPKMFHSARDRVQTSSFGSFMQARVEKSAASRSTRRSHADEE